VKDPHIAHLALSRGLVTGEEPTVVQPALVASQRPRPSPRDQEQGSAMEIEGTHIRHHHDWWKDL